MRRRAFVLQTLNLIDLVAILPWYVERVVTAAGATAELGFLSVLRLVRVVRVFKMSRNFQGFGVLSRTLLRSSTALYLLFVFILTLLIVFSTLMYQFEGPEGPTTYYDAERSQYLSGTPSPFRSIPESIYWCITTMTTVGYGDQAPITVLGRTVAVVCMLLGLVVLSLDHHHRIQLRGGAPRAPSRGVADAPRRPPQADRRRRRRPRRGAVGRGARLRRRRRAAARLPLELLRRARRRLRSGAPRTRRQRRAASSAGVERLPEGDGRRRRAHRAAREWHATIAAVGGGRGERTRGGLRPGAAGAGAAAPDLSKVAAEDQSIAACAMSDAIAACCARRRGASTPTRSWRAATRRSPLRLAARVARESTSYGFCAFECTGQPT